MALSIGYMISVPSPDGWQYAAWQFGPGRVAGDAAMRADFDLFAGLNDDKPTEQLVLVSGREWLTAGPVRDKHSAGRFFAACAPRVIEWHLNRPAELPRYGDGGVDLDGWLGSLRLSSRVEDLAQALDGGAATYLRLCREDVLYILINEYDQSTGVGKMNCDEIASSPFRRRYYDKDIILAVVQKLLAEKKLDGVANARVYVEPSRADGIREMALVARQKMLEETGIVRESQTLRPVPSGESHKEYDAFLCHASEDKVAIVSPFAEAMGDVGLKPWIDAGELAWGDNLIAKINHGLANSRYVVVFISKGFIGKEWPETELNAALSLEIGGKPVVLPLLCGISGDTLKRQYPLLSSKLCREVQEYDAAKPVGKAVLAEHVAELRRRLGSGAANRP